MVRGIDVAAAARVAPNSIARAMFAMAKAKLTGNDAEAVLKQLYPSDEGAAVVVKASANPGTTTTSGWASHLVQTAVGEFLGALGSLSAAAVLMRSGLSVSLDPVAAVNIPIRSTAPAEPAWVTEAKPIPVREDILASVPLGPARKLGAIVVATRELMKRSDAANVFNLMLREDASKGLDGAVFSSEDGVGDAHKGLLNGATTISGSGSFLRDLQALAKSVSIGGSGQVVFIGGPATAAAAGLDALVNAEVLASPAVAETRLIAVDPQSIVWGAGTDFEIDASTEGVLHMSADPLPIVGSGVAADPTRSLYQTACIATRLLLPISYAARRTGAVAYVDGLDYGS